MNKITFTSEYKSDFVNPRKITIEFEEESIDEIIEQFKSFLLAIGHAESTINNFFSS